MFIYRFTSRLFSTPRIIILNFGCSDRVALEALANAPSQTKTWIFESYSSDWTNESKDLPLLEVEQ